MRRKQHQILIHTVRVKIRDKDEYDQLLQWVKENVSTIDRLTPTWNDDRWDDEPKNMTFRFRHEENAMAFKLILNSYQQ